VINILVQRFATFAIQIRHSVQDFPEANRFIVKTWGQSKKNDSYFIIKRL